MASKNDEGWDDPLVFYLTWPSDKAEYNLQTKLALKNYFLVNSSKHLETYIDDIEHHVIIIDKKDELLLP